MPELLSTLDEFVKAAWPRRTTAAQSRTLMRLIATALEERLPVAPLLESLARDERGVQRRRLFRVTRLMNEQVGLVDALEQTPGVIGDAELLALRFDAQSGLRSAALRTSLDESRPQRSTRRNPHRQSLVYFCGLLSVVAAIATFMQLKITPLILRIASDFGVDKSPTISRVRDLQSGLIDGIWLVMLVACVALGLIYSTTTGRILRRAFIGSALNPWREGYIADVMRKMSVATAAGRPLTAALSTLARHHFDPVIRHKLLFTRNEVELGADMWLSLQAAGLVSAEETRLLQTSERIGNQAWVLGQIADQKRARADRRWRRRAAFILPLGAVLFGGFVLLQSLAMFLPLIEFLRGASP